MKQDFFDRLSEVVDCGQIKRNELLSRHTTFRIGGPADFFVEVKSAAETAGVLALCREEKMPCLLIGNGSNLLVSDRGCRGVVVRLAGELCGAEFEEDGERLTARAGAGRALTQFAREIAAHGGAGFEFAAGIPGSVGGAVYMNAGAYGSEMRDFLTGARVLTGEGELVFKTAEELELAYRSSRLQREDWYVLEAEFSFPRAEPESIRRKIEELAKKRAQKQPLEYPSAGSTFKRPEGHYAGKLIMDAGLAGLRVGGAEVSEKHCGFLINRGGATAWDVLRLADRVQNAVREKYGVTLELEVRLVGDFGG
ncbi:MAG: UDP-N-acetylmuramate dehydrogenase [Lachnospiraceae bacterium]|nr:UDP-N-acetylmuramate dehydrogenase [Lachnospiraceae bacterium]